MRKVKKKENKFDKLLDIPKEITTNIPKIIINGFEEILIENYKGILEYEENLVKIASYVGIININGIDLKLNQMKDDTVSIFGQIDSITMEKDIDN